MEEAAPIFCYSYRSLLVTLPSPGRSAAEKLDKMELWFQASLLECGRMPVLHEQTERKGSGAHPGPLAKSGRNRREGAAPERQSQTLSWSFLEPPSPKSL